MHPFAASMLITVLAVSACSHAASDADQIDTTNTAATAGSGQSSSSVVTTAGSSGQTARAPGVAGLSGAVAGSNGQSNGQSNGKGTVAGSLSSAGSGSLPAAGSGAAGTLAAAVAGAAGAPGAGSSGAAGQSGAAATTGNACDRACLLGLIQGYSDALVAQDSSLLKVSSDLKYTENGVAAKLGETVWTTAMSIVAGTTLSFADPVEGQVASQFVFAEGGSTQKIYQVRLKVVEHAITEIESMVVKNGDQFFNPSGMKPEPAFLEMVDPAKRATREQLVAITELYLGYLEGMKRAADVPFDTNCKRYENGTVTATGLASFNSQSWSFDVTHRILVVDEEAGITWGMFPFQQSATALVVGEAFKIVDDKIMMIQAVMTNMPTKAWD